MGAQITVISALAAAMAVAVHPAAPGKAETRNQVRHFTVTATKLLVRSKPGRQSEIIDAVPKGHRIDALAPTGAVETIDGLKGEWLKALTMKGREGYVFSAYLKPITAAPDYRDETDSLRALACGKDWKRCAEEREKELLLQHPAQAARVNDSLVFTGERGARTVLADKKTGGEDHIAYQLVRYIPELCSFAVIVHFYEGGTFCLVHEKTGKKTEVFGLPILSPGKDRFVAYNCDIVAGYTANGLQVFRINRDTSVTRLAEIRKTWGPVNVRWAGNDRIVFDRLDFAGEGYISSLGEIEISGDKYILID